jgi:hypothetical protein
MLTPSPKKSIEKYLVGASMQEGHLVEDLLNIADAPNPSKPNHITTK